MARINYVSLLLKQLKNVVNAGCASSLTYFLYKDDFQLDMTYIPMLNQL